MKRLIVAVAALLCACSPPATKVVEPPPDNTPVADAAGNRLEALTENAGRWCSDDGQWCAAIQEGRANIWQGETQLASLTVGPDAEIWPHIIRLGRDDARAIVGVVSVDQQMYSGGGGSARLAALFEVAPGQEANQLLAGIPIAAESLVRACFTEEHTAARQEACHDEYDFTGALSLDTSVSEGPPILLLNTIATTFPGRRSRMTDSTAEAPLRPGDLVIWRDDVCSYRRVATRRGDAYVWDEPLPECADYLEP